MNSNNLQSFVTNTVIEYITSEKSYKELYEELHIKHNQYKSNVKRTCNERVCYCGCITKYGKTCCICYNVICEESCCIYGCEKCGIVCEECYTELLHEVDRTKCEECDCYM